MNYEKIEQMLSDAKEQLPTTEREWNIPDVVETTYGTKKKRISKTMVASLAIIFTMVVGGGTVLASIGFQRYAESFGQWTGMRSNSWIDCETELDKRNGQLPEAFGDYEFESCSTTLVARDEVSSYAEALTQNVYTPLHIQYLNTMDDSKITISVGTTEEQYWHYYYEYEKIHKEGEPEIYDTWEPEKYDTYFEYRGIKVYSLLVEGTEDNVRVKWTWVDTENQNCWTVYVPQDTDVNGKELVKDIITLNASAWSDQTIYAHEQSELFEGFSLGDYKTETDVFPAIYNEDVYIIFYEGRLDITLNDSHEKFSVYVPEYIEYSLYNSRVSSKMYDVNQDGVEEIVFCSAEGGTINLRYVNVLDLANKRLIRMDYNVQQLVDAFYELDVTDSDSYGFDICCNDTQEFMKDGTIQVTTSFGKPLGEHGIDYVGRLVGTLVLDAEQNAYVLDENSVHIEWEE